MSASKPRAFLTSLGTDGVRHTSHLEEDGNMSDVRPPFKIHRPLRRPCQRPPLTLCSPALLSQGSFFEHLTGVEEDLASWDCHPDIVLAGLYHSIYGTESFQAFSLPLADPEGSGNRQQVRELIGERAELLAFVNCTMERNSLDEAVIAYHAADPAAHTNRLNAADATVQRVHRIRTRAGTPGDAVCHDPATGTRRAEIPAEFVSGCLQFSPSFPPVFLQFSSSCPPLDLALLHFSFTWQALSEQEMLDLTTLHLCDWLQQVVASNAEHTFERAMSYSQRGVPGYWLIPPHGYAGIRQEAFRAMAEVLGGSAMASYEQKQYCELQYKCQLSI